MIEIKQAIQNAETFAADVMGLKVPNVLPDVLVEEVVSGDSYWDITLSFGARLTTTKSRLMQIAGEGGEREYKSFRVDKTTGKVEAMRIRALN
jgi:hypothetical protein